MAPLPPDPYKILGVAKDAQTSEIRSSYRKLVLKCHPDKVQDPKLKEEKQNEFQRVQQAYELLNNDSERQKYDDKVRLDDLRRQMKEKQSTSSPKPSPKYSAEFEIRTPEMRSSTFKASPSPGKTYMFTRYDDDYVIRDARIFETKSRSSSKRETSFSERYSKRELEREKEREREREKDKDKDRERDRRRKEDDARRAKISKEALKADKKRQEKQRDRDIKRDGEEKLRQRFAKASIESYDDEPSKSERKRSTRKADDKGGRSSPRDEKPSSSSRPPLAATSRFTPYSTNDRIKYDRAATYVEASRAPPPPLYRSASYSGRSPYIPAAPSPPPTKKAFVMDDTDSDDNVRRSRAPSRRGSGDGPRLSRERSYRKGSNEVLEDHFAATASPAARHSTSFTRSAANSPHMATSPPRFDLPRVNSTPQPVFSRPSPGLARANTYGMSGEHGLPRGRERNRMHSQLESSESDDDFDRHDRERRYRSHRTQSPEPMAPREHVSRYEVDSGSRRTRRVAADADTGHAYYMHAQPVRVSESRMPANYREASYTGVPSTRGYGNPKTSKYHDIQYSEHYGPYRDAVRA